MKILPLARKAIRFELGLWKSLFRWALRRTALTDPTAVGFSYAGVVTPMFIGITVVAAIEIPVAHLLLPWAPVRLVLLLLGVQTLFWMIGLLASLRVNPHEVSDSGLRIRYGTGLDFTIAWQDIAAIRPRIRALHSNRTVVHEETEAGLVLSVGVASQTNLDVVLRRALTVDLRGETSEPFSQLRFYTDESAALVARARELIACYAVPDGTAPAATSG
ncbi:hypothetical protein Rhe02_27790 [Rhizocola hellebori]|uniref:PH domain-containing protein n=1 Tax=Rhizocola hellebori TaxID=1392758 RepID=A0A8J3Q7B9_9ACTN|nr:hypothetical protein [Rhizocola hellebori]GIH04712.1 hypothetical protein Rhe02_27790 [Rhizocola hellebori]